MIERTEDNIPEESRFEFGQNWRAFLNSVNEERIAQAMDSLCDLLGLCLDEAGQPLSGTRMLDLGSGSGLFSLAAHRLGASVVSVDYDEDSVACTAMLRGREIEKSDAKSIDWIVKQGSALEEAFLMGLGTFDLVYSWGVLHHTGEMWRAIELSAARVNKQGTFVLSIYNDQGRASRRWLSIKKTYNRLPRFLRPVMVVLVAGFYEFLFALARLKNGRNPLPFKDWQAKKKDRGMSVWHDWVDWIGGLPFEVASTDAIVTKLQTLGFQLKEVRDVGKGWGCNEYVAVKNQETIH